MREKLFLSLILSLCFGFTLSAQTEKDCIRIHGAQSSLDDSVYRLDGIDKITFSEDAMILHLRDTDITEMLYFSNFDLITFCSQNVGVEENISHEGINVSYNSVDCNIAISSPTSVLSIQLFDMSGKMLQSLSPQYENVTISLSSYPQGIYIIRVANSESIITQKIFKH